MDHGRSDQVGIPTFCEEFEEGRYNYIFVGLHPRTDKRILYRGLELDSANYISSQVFLRTSQSVSQSASRGLVSTQIYSMQ